MIATRNPFKQLPTIAQDPDKFEVLLSAQEFRTRLLSAINNAEKRIYLVALYLEDDEGGREILDALYQAKQKNPNLDIKVCVDWHRAQRGLIGADVSDGNARLYKEYSRKYEHHVPILGIPIRAKEVFGVLHLKGFIIDSSVIYSGASLNNVYLHYLDRYRFDRYHVLTNAKLANSMAKFIENELINHPVVHDLSRHDIPSTKELKPLIRQFRARLTQAKYHFKPDEIAENRVAITPLVGIGRNRNKLNHNINKLLSVAKDEIIICTPYFNFPRSVAKEVAKALKRGVKIKLIIGDKTANDFYISPEQPFKTIGGLPYLYEMNLRRFAKTNEAHIASRCLSIHLWKHETNSFHLKGIWSDRKYILLTGNNLNPRAWGLDLENALFIQDPHQQLHAKFEQEINNILKHTQLIGTYEQIEKIEDYPIVVQRLLRKITRVKADGILKQIL